MKAKEIKINEVNDGGTDRGLLFKPYYTFTGGSSGKTNYSVIHVLCTFTFTFINFSEKKRNICLQKNANINGFAHCNPIKKLAVHAFCFLYIFVILGFVQILQLQS